MEDVQQATRMILDHWPAGGLGSAGFDQLYTLEQVVQMLEGPRRRWLEMRTRFVILLNAVQPLTDCWHELPIKQRWPEDQQLLIPRELVSDLDYARIVATADDVTQFPDHYNEYLRRGGGLGQHPNLPRSTCSQHPARRDRQLCRDADGNGDAAGVHIAQRGPFVAGGGSPHGTDRAGS